MSKLTRDGLLKPRLKMSKIKSKRCCIVIGAKLEQSQHFPCYGCIAKNLCQSLLVQLSIHFSLGVSFKLYYVLIVSSVFVANVQHIQIKSLFRGVRIMVA